jgi:hypothetical protein
MVFLFLEKQGNFLIDELGGEVGSCGVFKLSTMYQIESLKLIKSRKLFFKNLN